MSHAAVSASESASPKPLNLALVVERYDPFAGGAERSAAQIAEELVRRGHRVTVIAATAGWDFDPGALTIHAYARRRSASAVRLLGFHRWAKRQLEAGQFDTALSVTMAVPAPVVQPRAGTVRETLERLVARRRTSFDRGLKRVALALNAKQQAFLAIERRVLADPAVQRVIGVSRYVVDELHRHYGLASPRVQLIPNAAVMPPADDEQRRQWRRSLRAGFGIDEDATVHLFAAEDPQRKGFDTLLRAMRRLVDDGQDKAPVVLLVGKIGYGEQKAVADAGLTDYVRYVGPTRQMPAVYAASDVTVLPTYYDPASKVVIESLMMGVPAISTGYNGASDFIRPEGRDTRGRVIADPADDQALATAMSELGDPAVREQCRAAMAGLADELSMARHVDQLERLLAETARPGTAAANPTEPADAPPPKADAHSP